MTSFDPTDGVQGSPDDCPECRHTLYDGGCDGPGHVGVGCPNCGWGCDLGLMPDEDSRCAAEIAAEDPDARAERLDAERSLWGLSSAEG
jgi:hypothetical protein